MDEKSQINIPEDRMAQAYIQVLEEDNQRMRREIVSLRAALNMTLEAQASQTTQKEN